MTRFTLSSFGERYAGHTGISELMTDISAPPTDPSQPLCMLGGGNLAIIPELSQAWAEATRATLEDPGFRRLVGAYDSHIGRRASGTHSQSVLPTTTAGPSAVATWGW